MTVVECPTCRRPIARLNLVGDRVQVTGSTYAENEDPGGVLTVYPAPREWAARVYSTDPALEPGTASGGGRRTFVCNGRRHHLRWVKTEETLAAALRRADEAGRKRVSMDEMR